MYVLIVFVFLLVSGRSWSGVCYFCLVYFSYTVNVFLIPLSPSPSQEQTFHVKTCQSPKLFDILSKLVFHILLFLLRCVYDFHAQLSMCVSACLAWHCQTWSSFHDPTFSIVPEISVVFSLVLSSDLVTSLAVFQHLLSSLSAVFSAFFPHTTLSPFAVQCLHHYITYSSITTTSVLYTFTKSQFQKCMKKDHHRMTSLLWLMMPVNKKLLRSRNTGLKCHQILLPNWKTKQYQRAPQSGWTAQLQESRSHWLDGSRTTGKSLMVLNIHWG